MLQNDLFEADRQDHRFAVDAMLLPGFALSVEASILAALENVLDAAPLRYWQTRGGRIMSATKSNCGTFGWVSDRTGYHYTTPDPDSHKLWPAMPEIFLSVARSSALAAGFSNFNPDSCLINGYTPTSKLTLHQDRDEKDLQAPIVILSLGITATFLFGGLTRQEQTKKVTLKHGDVVVWGGASRLAFHGITTLKADMHPTFGMRRISLTFRKAV